MLTYDEKKKLKTNNWQRASVQIKYRAAKKNRQQTKTDSPSHTVRVRHDLLTVKLRQYINWIDEQNNIKYKYKIKNKWNVVCVFWDVLSNKKKLFFFAFCITCLSLKFLLAKILHKNKKKREFVWCCDCNFFSVIIYLETSKQ